MADLVVRVSANIESLRAELAKARASIETIEQSAKSTTGSLDDMIRGMNEAGKAASASGLLIAGMSTVGREAAQLAAAAAAAAAKPLDDMARGMNEAGKAASASGKLIAGMSASGHEAAQRAAALGAAGREAAPHVGTLGDSMRTFDGVLSSVGIHIGPEIKAIGEIGDASGKSATQLGVLGTAGLAVGAAVAGWKIGRLVADFFDLDEKIGNATAKLLGWGDAVGEAAGAKADALRLASERSGRTITDEGEALRVNTEFRKKHNEEAKVSAIVLKASADAAKADADALLASAAAHEKALQKLTDQFSGGALLSAASDYSEVLLRMGNIERLTVDEKKQLVDQFQKTIDKYRLMGPAGAAVVEHFAGLVQQLQPVPTKLLEIESGFGGLTSALDNLGTHVKPALSDIEPLLKAAADAAKALEPPLNAVTHDLENTARAMETAARATYTVHSAYSIGGSMADMAAAAAARGGVVAYDDHNNPYIHIPGVNMPGRGQPQHRAEGGSVEAARPYVVGERGPELFVPRAAGSIVPSGGGGMVTNIYITQPLGTPQAIADAVGRSLMARQRERGTRFPVGV